MVGGRGSEPIFVRHARFQSRESARFVAAPGDYRGGNPEYFLARPAYFDGPFREDTSRPGRPANCRAPLDRHYHIPVFRRCDEPGRPSDQSTWLSGPPLPARRRDADGSRYPRTRSSGWSSIGYAGAHRCPEIAMKAAAALLCAISLPACAPMAATDGSHGLRPAAARPAGSSYRISGDSSVRPLSVRDDGVRMEIVWSRAQAIP